jgi:ribosomal protein S18 acetylase RimI-like enzyme
MGFRLRRIDDRDREWIRSFIRDQWSGESVVVHGAVYYPHLLSGFIAEDGKGEAIGLATYHIQDAACELVSLDSMRRGEGVGSALIAALVLECGKQKCSRLWCVTTNDNLPALEFYQKRGFHIVAVHPGAVERARILKPSIPLWGIESIPIRDEIELEMQLDTAHDQ